MSGIHWWITAVHSSSSISWVFGPPNRTEFVFISPAGHEVSMKKRAVKSEDKETKRLQIVSSAKALFAERDFFRVKMEDVAQMAGVAKGTLYIYFSTKEELFLAVTESELSLWFETLDVVLSEFPRSDTAPSPYQTSQLANALGEAIASTLRSHPTIPRDLSLVFNVLEHNVAPDRLMAFKEVLVQRIDTLCTRVKGIIPHTQDDCWHLQLAIHALILGSWQLANPPFDVRESQLENPCASRLTPTFGNFFAWSLQHLLGGFLRTPLTSVPLLQAPSL